MQWVKKKNTVHAEMTVLILEDWHLSTEYGLDLRVLEFLPKSLTTVQLLDMLLQGLDAHQN